MNKTIAILDYGAGNLTSIRLAFERLDARPVVTGDAAEALRADALVFPGVGSAKSAMEGLLAHGLDAPIRAFLDAGRPVLAICLGMQMSCARSEEDGGVDGLGFVPGVVRRFRFAAPANDVPSSKFQVPSSKSLVSGSEVLRRPKVPHMGWNTIRVLSGHPVFAGLDGQAFYFVHSYYVGADCPAAVCRTEYAGFEFTSAIATGSLVATQFHPERSGEAGLRLLRNFLAWEGSPCC